LQVFDTAGATCYEVKGLDYGDSQIIDSTEFEGMDVFNGA
jgi:hypothetical protein